MEDYYYQLILDYYENKITDKGLTDLSDWIESGPENLAAFRETLVILEGSKRYLRTKEDADSVWNRIYAGISNESNQPEEPESAGRSYRPVLAYAAIITLVLSVSLLLFNGITGRKAHTPEFAEIYNPKGKRTKVVLPDSSVVYLNATSRIRYSKRLNSDKRREIFLEGEAFFDVKQSAERPFLVHSHSVTTTVLGTSFNIKAFKEEEKITVTVQSGKVAVSISENGNDKFLQYLLPDQQLSVNTHTGNYSFTNLMAGDEISWKDNRIVFNNLTIEEIGRSLERWYDINVVISHPQLSGCRFTAKFDYIPLNQLMDIMTQLTGYRYSLKNNQLIINNKKCNQEDDMN